MPQQSASKLFEYNLKNLQETCKLRGENRKRVLKEMEFMRTHEFKSMPRPENKSFGVWIKRKKPIRKIKNFKCKR